MTDSEKYSDGKLKRTRKGSEKESETLCLQAAKALYMCDSVLFVERSGECMLQARLRC